MTRVDSFPVPTVDIAALQHGLREIVEAKRAAIEPEEKPVFVHMLGVPGAGKTTFATSIHRELSSIAPRRPLYVGFDELMSAIPDYVAAPDRVNAFAAYELPAREAGYALLSAALIERGSVLFDHGGAVPEHVRIVVFASTELGYKTCVVYVRCDASEAKRRIVERTRLEGRHTSLDYVDERAAVTERLIPQYVAAVDGFFVIQNSTVQAEPQVAQIAGSIARGIQALR